ncbi:MAG: DUF4956 domain-containing protein [Dehalococcoidia bacterium]
MSNDLNDFILGGLFNFASVLIIVRFIYYPWTQNRSYVFTFLAFNPAIYFVMAMLTSIELSIGVGFGLFAIFSVIRYRTEEMPIREMTYLFIIIALPVMNSVVTTGDAWDKILIANVAMVVILYVLEREWGFAFELSRRITYDRIDLIKPDQYEALCEDIRQRTGISASRIEFGRTDFLRDVVELKVYYDSPGGRRGLRQQGLGSEYTPAGRHLLEP